MRNILKGYGYKFKTFFHRNIAALHLNYVHLHVYKYIIYIYIKQANVFCKNSHNNKLVGYHSLHFAKTKYKPFIMKWHIVTLTLLNLICIGIIHCICFRKIFVIKKNTKTTPNVKIYQIKLHNKMNSHNDH